MASLPQLRHLPEPHLENKYDFLRLFSCYSYSDFYTLSLFSTCCDGIACCDGASVSVTWLIRRQHVTGSEQNKAAGNLANRYNFNNFEGSDWRLFLGFWLVSIIFSEIILFLSSARRQWVRFPRNPKNKKFFFFHFIAGSLTDFIAAQLDIISARIRSRTLSTANFAWSHSRARWLLQDR